MCLLSLASLFILPVTPHALHLIKNGSHVAAGSTGRHNEGTESEDYRTRDEEVGAKKTGGFAVSMDDSCLNSARTETDIYDGRAGCCCARLSARLAG